MKLTYIGPLNKTGYGVASVGYANQLCKINPEMAVVPIGPVDNPDISPELRKGLEVLPDYSAPVFCFWHIFDLEKQVSKFTGPKVAFSTFELDKLYPNEVEILNRFDLVGTASSWGEKVIKDSGVTRPTFTAPHALKADDNTLLPKYTHTDPSIWNSLLAPNKIVNDTIFTTAGKFEIRKGHYQLIDAFIELGKNYPIALIAFFHNPFIPDSYPYSFINSRMMYPSYTNSGIKVYTKNKFKLVLMPPTQTRDELHRALFKGHYFISPSLAEGWNLPLFEMLSLGMPCIHTINTAQTEYCHDSPLAIHTNGTTPAIDGQFFKGFGNWANLTVQDIKNTVIPLLENSSNISIDAITDAYRSKLSVYTWQQSARKIQTLLTQL